MTRLSQLFWLFKSKVSNPTRFASQSSKNKKVVSAKTKSKTVSSTLSHESVGKKAINSPSSFGSQVFKNKNVVSI